MESLPTIIDPRKFFTIFKGRMDRVAVYSARDRRVGSTEIKRGDWEVVERAKAHLAGQSRMGIYNHLPDNTCLWAVVMFEESSGNPTARESVLFASEASKLGLRDVKRERGKVKGENYQCWVFFEKPILVKKVRQLLNAILKKLGITKAVLLPTEDELTAGSVGDFAWLPYFGGVDTWVTPEGEARVDQGMKQGHTVFLDEEGAAMKDPFGVVHRCTEEEIDNAFTYLNEYIPPEPTPGEGIRIMDSHLRKLSEKCDAFKAMQQEIIDKRVLADEGTAYLGNMMKSLQREDFYHKILSRTADYDKGRYDKKLATQTGRSFATCLAFKNAGYCPADKICFEKRPPLMDRYGKLEEDKNKPPEMWREPSPILWIFQSIKERMGEEEEAETVVIDADIRSHDEYFDELEKELAETRNQIIKSKRNFSGMDTGFALMNQVLDGLKPDTLLVLAGAPSSGKTGLCLQLLDQVAQLEGVPCCYISYGEPKNRIVMRSLSRFSGVDVRKIMRGILTDEELQKIKVMQDKIKQAFAKSVFVIEGNDSMGTRKLKDIMDFINVKLLIVDSLQSLPYMSKQAPPDFVSRYETIMQQLKTLARYRKIPIIAVHTLPEGDSKEGALIDSLVYSLSDVYLQLTEKPPQGQEASTGVRELSLLVRKNRGGDRNIALKYAAQIYLQKFAEVK